jgi:hypothetical protein
MIIFILSSSLITDFLPPGISPLEPVVHPTAQASRFRSSSSSAAAAAAAAGARVA